MFHEVLPPWFAISLVPNLLGQQTHFYGDM